MTVHPFPPVYDSRCGILILGSFPSVMSRETGFYYGHRQNRFWKVLAAVFGGDVPETITEKTRFLLTHHIALWDVIRSCEITGSSDSSVRNAEINNIAGLLEKTDVGRIVCNGRLAGKLYERYVGRDIAIPVVTMPSTSPANAAWSLERLTAEWKKALT
ncbi:MAG: DNA-deoxyinosine glycosylase [Clostridiales bacterium]|nr:DNA-deoxyinosine glycosylase [Clostridiales bacterium]